MTCRRIARNGLSLRSQPTSKRVSCASPADFLCAEHLLAGWFLRGEQLSDDRLVTLLVPRLEAELRVSDDAAGVNDVGGSPVGVALAEVGAVSEKHRVGYTEPLCHALCGLRVRRHRDGEHEKPAFCVLLVKSLEMDHLLAAERSVS